MSSSNPPQNENESQAEVFDMQEQMRLLSLENAVEPCNVILIAGKDNQRVACHREMLSKRSDYFAAMFSANMLEQTAKEVTLEEVYGIALRPIVKYCYTGKIEIEDSYVKDLMHNASMLRFENIVEECSEYRSKQLELSTCLGIATEAQEYNFQSLFQSCAKYINSNFLELKSNEKFAEISSKLLIAIISGDDLAVHTEHDVYNGIMAWVNHDLTERSKYIPQLFALLRMPFMSRDFLRETVLPICEKSGCAELVNKIFEQDAELAMKQVYTKARKWIVTKMLIVSKVETLVRLESYCPVANKWTTLAEIPKRQDFYSAALINHQLVLVGNRKQYGTTGREKSGISIFDIITKTVTVIKPMPTKRKHFEVVVMDDCIYAVGGEDKYEIALETVERYDLKTQLWTTLEPMHIGRMECAVTVFRGRLYVAGGSRTIDCGDGYTSLVYHRTVESYDPQTNKWTMHAEMNHPRSRITITGHNGCLYLFGMVHRSEIECSYERYDLAEDAWTLFDESALDMGVLSTTVDGAMYAVHIRPYSETESVKAVQRFDNVDDFSRRTWKVPERRYLSWVFPKPDICQIDSK